MILATVVILTYPLRLKYKGVVYYPEIRTIVVDTKKHLIR